MKTKSKVAKAKKKVSKPLTAEKLCTWFRRRIEDAICGKEAATVVREFAKSHDQKAVVDMGGVWDAIAIAGVSFDDLLFAIIEYIMEEIDSGESKED